MISKNLSFIPVDVRFGPTGAMYVCDWYNPVKGHAQYSLRDDRRDRTSGRIWRITPKNAESSTAPKIYGANVEELLELLFRVSHVHLFTFTRFFNQRVLRSRDVWWYFFQIQLLFIKCKLNYVSHLQRKDDVKHFEKNFSDNVCITKVIIVCILGDSGFFRLQGIKVLWRLQFL